MSSPAPAVSPESNAGDLISPADVTAPSPENNDFTPPPSPAITLPSLPPLVAPPLPLVVGGTTSPPSSPILSPPLPTPTLSPTSQPQPPQPQPLPQLPPQPQPQPQPSLSAPPPITKNTPPPESTSPPNIISPPLGKPINITPSPSQNETPPSNTIPPPLSRPINITPPPLKETPSPNIIPPPLGKPIDIKPPPPTSNPSIPNSPPSFSNPTNPYSPPSPPESSQSPETRPTTHPNPSQPAPQRPKNTPTTPRPPSPLPTSAALPSPPPVALPVPQSPGGGAWIPFSAEAPTPLPLLPTPPGTSSSPATRLHGSNNGASSSSSSGDNQNIQAAAVEPKGSNNGGSGIVVGLAVGGVLVLLLAAVCVVLLVFYKRKKKKEFDDFESGRKHAPIFNEIEEKSSLPLYTKQDSDGNQGLQSMVNVSKPKGSSMTISGTPQAGLTPRNGPAFSGGTFTYEELIRTTNNFSEQNLLGQGGFGYVHKGVLPNGKEVAVKQLKMGGHQGEREFRAEVETISQVHHKHLVSLVGYCISGAERLLIYEFVPNNTLEFHLNGEGQPAMDWPTRLKIAIGSAKGIAYLHEDCSPSIIHRDIKAANILLDFNYEAKVSDFGLAKIFSSSNPSVTHMTTRVVGTFGYLAPEYASSGKVTDKSDIYSYGVMLLELITGRPPISNFGSASSGSLVNWARPLLAQAIGDGKFDSLADPRLENNYDVNEMASMVACAAACVRLSAWRRPKMSQVVRALEGNLPTSELDDGMRPGQSSMHFPYESLDFGARNYLEDMKRMALTNDNGYSTTSRYSENTSEYGLHPSASSTDSSQPGRS